MPITPVLPDASALPGVAFADRTVSPARRAARAAAAAHPDLESIGAGR
jgi:hypothetical protein